MFSTTTYRKYQEELRNSVKCSSGDLADWQKELADWAKKRMPKKKEEKEKINSVRDYNSVRGITIDSPHQIFPEVYSDPAWTKKLWESQVTKESP